MGCLRVFGGVDFGRFERSRWPVSGPRRAFCGLRCQAFGRSTTAVLAHLAGRLRTAGRLGQVVGERAVAPPAVDSLLKFSMGIRVSEEEDMQGLDISEHGIQTYPESAATN